MFFPSSRYLKSLLLSSVLALGTTSTALAHVHEQHQHEQHKHEAHDNHQTIMVMDGYARATFALAKTGAVYFTLHNSSTSPVTLSGVDVDNSVADEAQIHTTVMQDEMMQMREVSEGVVITPNEKVLFKPGGYHVMLLGLSKGLEEGSEVPLTLHFKEGEAMEIELEVVLPVKKEGEANHHHHHKDHH